MEKLNLFRTNYQKMNDNIFFCPPWTMCKISKLKFRKDGKINLLLIKYENYNLGRFSIFLLQSGFYDLR